MTAQSIETYVVFVEIDGSIIQRRFFSDADDEVAIAKAKAFALSMQSRPNVTNVAIRKA